MKEIEKLTSGPGKLTCAFGVPNSFTGLSICKNYKLFVAEGNNEELKIGSSHRIGLKEDLSKKLRFYIINNKFVSGN
ncbi:MAG: DNA-3-methyladenine glycosylase [Candidatus Thermoplasmatota archaeon]|nr:DNA-3-methyladenine glycosylase [Candidatus Thermoplasmatota archaeon]